jgi:hypothetical protein
MEMREGAAQFREFAFGRPGFACHPVGFLRLAGGEVDLIALGGDVIDHDVAILAPPLAA